MKAKYFIWMVAIALFGSCSNEDNLLNDSLGENVVSASIEGANSRVGFEYANRTGQFFWSGGDAIGVYHGTSFYKYNLQGNGGGSTGNFIAEQTTITGASQLCALYPYNSSHTVSGNSVQFYMSPEYTYVNEDTEFGTVNGNPTNVPMLAKIATEGSTNFTFGHLGGALCFKFINVPANACKFVFTANSKITGLFDVVETNNDPKISTPASSSSDNTVTINFTAENEATTKVFYVPMPNGTYTGFTWKFLNSSNSELKTYTTTTAVNTITDGKLLTITYTLDGSGIGNIASTASNMTDLKNALESGDDNIQLTANIELTDNLNVSENTTIDLNGQNLKAGSNTITVGEGKSLTLTNNSTSGVARSATTSGISGSGDIIIASKGSTITIGEGVDLITTGTKSCCVWIPSGAENVTLNTAGNLKATSAGAAVIYHNGLLGSGTINITGGSVEHETDVAVYIAGKADVTVSGNARITGTTAMEVRAGKLTVNGGKFEATATPSEYKPNGNGTTSVGVALAVVKHSTTGNNLEVEINGGEFTGVKNLLVNKELGPVSVYVEGGTFSDASAFDYLADNANVTLGADMEIEKAITIPTGIAATINLNGFDITAPNTDAFEVAGTLTIKDTKNEGVVSAGTVNPAASVCAVWANGGTVTIDGGHYKVYSDASGKRNDCIYAGYNADNNDTAGNITINGGKFEYVWPKTKNSGVDYNGDMFLLNCADKDLYQTLITVNGGEFKNNAPSYEATTPKGRKDNEVKLGEGKAVYSGGNMITNAHSSTTDIWYVVK